MKKSIGPELAKKYEHLQAILQDLGSVAVAFSSGVDSTFLVKVAHDVLGEKAVAFTAASDFVPQRDVEEAAAFTADEGIEFHRVPFPILMVPHVRENPSDRCYYCKYALFSHMKELAEQHGLACVVDGSNLDDDGDYRPGHRALRELGIVSRCTRPGSISRISATFPICWDCNLGQAFVCLPGFAFPVWYGAYASRSRACQSAEEFLMARGFRQLRVRAYGDQARIELLPEDIPRMLSRDLREETAAFFRRIGFLYTSLDLRGYRTGSMNEALASH